MNEKTYNLVQSSIQEAMNPPLTMSSLEIAELTDKEHKNVIRDIRVMCAGLKIEPSVFEGSYQDSTGRSLVCFHLPQRECLILVSGYSVELRAKIIDRWQELERQAKAGPAIPQTLPEALRLAADLAEQVTQQKAAIAELAPKADALDRIAEAEGSLCITDAAKALQMRPKDLFTYLRSHGWIYRRIGSPHDLGYQSKVAAGLLEHKVTTVLRADGTEKLTEQVRVTPKGLAALAKLFPPAVAAE